MFGIEELARVGFGFLYRRRSPSRLSRRRPRLKWLPKYRAKVALPDEILQAKEPDRVLEERMGDLGFELDSWTRDAIRFTRGKSWGDFSVKLIKLQASIPLPLQRKSSLKLEVAGVCLFDTGDTWDVCRDLVERVEAAA